MVGAAAQKFHHVRAVRAPEAEHVDEKRHLLVRVSAVEHDVADLGRARAIEDDVEMLRAIRRDAHRQSVGRLEAEAIAAAGGAGQRRRIAQNLDAIRLGLGAELIDGGAQMNPVAVNSDLVERPNLDVEIRRLPEIAHAELDAAHAGDLSVRHHLSSGRRRMKHSAMQSLPSFVCEDADRLDVTISSPAEPINDYVAKQRDGSYASTLFARADA